MLTKKIYVSAPWVFEIREEEFNERIEDPRELLLQNCYSHLSAGTEMACVSGIESWFTIPDVPGYTAIARVLEKGSAVDHVETGDIVYTYGPHAGNFKIDSTDRWHGVCVKVPDGLDPAIASFTHMAGIALTSIRKSSIELGDFVAVSGMGAIGNFAAQFAQLQGARVLGIDINNNRLEIARKSSILNTFNSAEGDLEARIAEFTGGEKVSSWIDASGQAAVVNDSMQHIAGGGEMILLGSPRSAYDTDLTPFLQKIHLLDNIRLIGALEFLIPTHQNDFVKHSIERNAAQIMRLMLEERLLVKPFFSHLLKPEQAEQAYTGLRDKPDEYIGVVFDWNL